MARMYRRLDDDLVRALAQRVNGGESIADVARDAGIRHQWSLSKRMRGLRLVEDRPERVQQTTLSFHARCTECGALIESRQRGEGDSGWMRWVRLARRHAAQRHGVTTRDGTMTWAQALWLVAGDRTSCILDRDPE